MNITATVLLAFGMSMDAFAASIGKGATLHKPKFSEALRTGAPDGVCQAATLPPRWCALTAPFQLFSCVAHAARTACSEQGSLLFCGTFRRVAPPSR